MIDVTDNADEVRRDVAEAERAISDHIRRGVERAVTEGAEEARSHIHSVSGRLAEKTTGRVEVSAPGGATGVIEAGTEYASFVEEGTEPHAILPKAAAGLVGPLPEGQSRRKRGTGAPRSFLSWVGADGAQHFAREVHHPGTQPHPFLGPAYLKAERVLEAEAELGIARAQEILDR